jgi:hypothetical protein
MNPQRGMGRGYFCCVDVNNSNLLRVLVRSIKDYVYNLYISHVILKNS